MRPAVLYGLETEVAQFKLRFSLGVTRVARIYEFHVVKEDIQRIGVSEEDVTDRVHDLLWTDTRPKWRFGVVLVTAKIGSIRMTMIPIPAANLLQNG